ncbi:myo-inositol-1(or 4)-monophosphatase [Mycobacterium sp. MAA66]|uniref:inositol monophosphatase family protein n=1 Tax=Mycobacterium sp. MAA66 TaxID=3156297 RepID=UPI00351988EB
MCCDGEVTAYEVDGELAPAHLRGIAEQLAAEAADFVRRRRGEVFGGERDGLGGQGNPVRAKSTPTDPVTIVDTETERLLRDRLAELRPADQVLGEEEGGSAQAQPGRPVWVLDPIDGTVNFVYGLGAYAVSVGVQIDGVSVAGAVANAATGEVYSAALGHGARRRRGDVSIMLRCNMIDNLSMALVATGFSYDSMRRRLQGAVLAELLPQVRDVRRVGSCALDLCMVAAGQLDAYYESGVHVWDWAAGALIAAEAGAVLRLPPVGASEATGGDIGASEATGGDVDSAVDDLIIAAAPGIADDLTGRLVQAGYR